jgi:trans-2,3-dihydro-3-hydroxyanthranilate isomerase
MSASVPFVLVDVFADAPLTGNPLAVVADAEQLEEPVMRAVAREFNQSETTFVLPATRPGAIWRLRSFTPAGAEVVGAGHNALGALWWLATAGRIDLDAEGGATLAQEIGGRVLPVEIAGRNGRPEAIVMEQAPPRFGRTVIDRDELARALGLEPGGPDLLDDVPAQVVSTGAAHLLVPVRDRAVVDRARPDGPRLAGPARRLTPKVATCTAWIPSIRPPSRTPGSSTRPSASRRIPRPAAPPVRSSAAWSHTVWCPTARPCSSSRATPWDVRAGSGCR